ncbi:MAG: HupE/UreJ family protein [Acidimicrobiales bacterium]
MTIWVAAAALTAGLAQPVLGHENQVIQYGSFLAGLTHPVLGLDHFLAMVSVGIVSAIIGGRAIWTVPATFVVMMGVGGLVGAAELGIVPEEAVELAIAFSVIALGAVILLNRQLPVFVAMAVVAFFGFFHGFAHGAEIPEIADPLVYAAGFIIGTILLHLLGVLIGDIAKRYQNGILVLRAAGGVFVIIGAMFILGLL